MPVLDQVRHDGRFIRKKLNLQDSGLRRNDTNTENWTSNELVTFDTCIEKAGMLPAFIPPASVSRQKTIGQRIEKGDSLALETILHAG